MAATDHGDAPRPGVLDRLYRWRTSLMGSRRFQAWAAKTPFAASIARRDGERLFDLTAGFIHSQVLMAFVQLDLADHLADRPRTVQDLALRLSMPPDRVAVLCQATTALGLMKRTRNDRYALGRLGAALPGVPGLAQMIRHHDVLYRDLSDPVAFFRDGRDTELAAFWPYVLGASGQIDPDTAAIYSDLMAQSQTLVAEETLRHTSLDGIDTLLDIGGGTGAFLTSAGRAYPRLKLHLFDLPVVADAAAARFGAAGLTDRSTITGGSFRTDAIPGGADAISLVRVLYDHGDDTVRMLLAKAHAALPPGGRILVSEPMSGGARPTRPGDVYFGIYCMAMQTGRARSAAEISNHLKAAGFSDLKIRKTGRPFITGVVEARKLST